MMWRALAVAGAVVLLLAFGAGVWMIGHSPAPPAVVRGSDTDASPAPTSHITATLFFGDAGDAAWSRGGSMYRSARRSRIRAKQFCLRR